LFVLFYEPHTNFMDMWIDFHGAFAGEKKQVDD